MIKSWPSMLWPMNLRDDLTTTSLFINIITIGWAFLPLRSSFFFTTFKVSSTASMRCWLIRASGLMFRTSYYLSAILLYFIVFTRFTYYVCAFIEFMPTSFRWLSAKHLALSRFCSTSINGWHFSCRLSIFLHRLVHTQQCLTLGSSIQPMCWPNSTLSSVMEIETTLDQTLPSIIFLIYEWGLSRWSHWN